MAWVALAAAAVGAAAKAGTPSPAMAAPVASDPFGMFDHSGWAVRTGSGAGDATATAGADLAGMGGPGAAGSSLMRYLPWMIGGLVAIVGVKAWAKSKK